VTLVGKRYAKALLAVAIENNKIEEYKEDLECLIKYFEEVCEFKFFIENSQLGKEEKKDTMSKILANDCDEKFLNFVKVLIDKDRMNILSDILENYEILANEYQNIIEIKVTSAMSLDDYDIEKIKEKYKSYFEGFKIKIKNVIDKDIIGGLKLEFGDTVIDATLKTKLNDLRNHMLDLN